MQPQLQLHPHPPVHPHPPLQPQFPLQPQLPLQPQEHPPPQPQLFPPQPQQQNRMMMRTIQRHPFSFPLLKHILSHLSLDPGPAARDLGFEIFYAPGLRREPDPL